MAERLHQMADLVFEVPIGKTPFWPVLDHELLTVGLLLHFSSNSPWCIKGPPQLLGVDRQLQEMWESADRDQWAVLHQLCQLLRVLDGL
jgi:hypothetical protein